MKIQKNLTIVPVVMGFFALTQVVMIVQTHHNVLDFDTPEEYNLKLQNHSTTHRHEDHETNDSSTKSIERNDAKSNTATQSLSNIHPDGHFNSQPIIHKKFEAGWHSNVHCIGENFSKDSWKYRSCQFQNLCFDMQNQSFVLFTSPEQSRLEEALRDANLTEVDVSFSMNTTVSIGGLNMKWSESDTSHMEWFPRLVHTTGDIEKEGYYSFVNDVVLTPFHSLGGFNPGHLVWDDFLPIYTLLTMFQLLDKDLVLMRYKPKFWQWASCDRRWNSGRDPHCKNILKKFLPLIGQDLDRMTTQENVNMTWSQDKSANVNASRYVCAANGVAGMGMITDHGGKLHGWDKADYKVTQNIGRGGVLYEFRNWMMNNIDVAPHKAISKAPYKVVFNVHSSSTSIRSVHFNDHIKIVKERIGLKYDVDVQVVTMSHLSLVEQVDLVSGATILVTMCGGGAVTSMFLPKGASLFVFFNEDERSGTGNAMPRLDWDLLNNLSHIRTHWLPRPQRFGTKYEGPRAADFEAFARLVEHELDVVSFT